MRAFAADALEEYAHHRAGHRPVRGSLGRPGPIPLGPELTAMGFAIAASLFIGADPQSRDAGLEGLRPLRRRTLCRCASRSLRSRARCSRVLSLARSIDRAIDDHETRPRKDVLSRLLGRATAGTGWARRGPDRDLPLLRRVRRVIGGLSMLAQSLGSLRKSAPARARRSPPGSLRAPGDGLAKARVPGPRLQGVTPGLAGAAHHLLREGDARALVRGRAHPGGAQSGGLHRAYAGRRRHLSCPDRFDPDRWLTASERQQKAWIPHGGGIHTEGHRCAGEALATLMLKAFAVRMLRRYDWSVKGRTLLLPGEALRDPGERAPGPAAAEVRAVARGPADWKARATALAGSALFLAIAPGTLAGYVPWRLTRWSVGPAFLGIAALQVAGGVLLALGVLGLFDCFRRFAVEGLGTPAPVLPPRTLVVTGLYRFVRNPMYCAVVSTIAGEALLLGSGKLLLYDAAVWLMFHFWVLVYEEPRLAESFGPGYQAFRKAVPRWIPRLMPWRGVPTGG